MTRVVRLGSVNAIGTVSSAKTNIDTTGILPLSIMKYGSGRTRQKITHSDQRTARSDIASPSPAQVAPCRGDRRVGARGQQVLARRGAHRGEVRHLRRLARLDPQQVHA